MASFVIFVGSTVVAETIEWTDHLAGFKSSFFGAMLFSIAWLGLVFPLNLLVGGLYHWRRWQRGRTWLVLAPSLLLFSVVILGEIIDPPTAAGRFRHITGMAIPSSAENLQHDFRGLGIGGSDEHFYFRCQPAETQLLIKTAGLQLLADYPLPDPKTLSNLGFPDLQNWPNPKVYRLDNQTERFSIDLVTYETNRQVYLHFMGD